MKHLGRLAIFGALVATAWALRDLANAIQRANRLIEGEIQ